MISRFGLRFRMAASYVVVSAAVLVVEAALSRGRSNREVARALSLGEQTVKSHVSSILAKLGLQDRTQAAIFGLQQGMVPLGGALLEEEGPASRRTQPRRKRSWSSRSR